MMTLKSGVSFSIVRPEYRGLFHSALAGILAPTLVAVTICAWARGPLAVSASFPGKLLVLLSAGAIFILRGLPAHHPYSAIGAANQVTIARGTVVAILAALIGEQGELYVQFVALALATAAALMDALDGWLARRTKMVSAFGARFDMETDALFVLVLSILAVQFGKAGAWVVACGALRYAFVLSGWLVPRLAVPLPPSARRKAVAAIQMVALLVVIAPFVATTISAPIAAVALFTLSISFLIDTAWLLRHPVRTATADTNS
jgi:phosphatidylglycerophosphate synthase